MEATPRFRSLSVVTVTYNSAGFVTEALRSAEAAAAGAGLDLQLVVVDNASSDATVEVVRDRFPTATVVANGENVGFARANNQAFRLATGDLWLMLNPDAVLRPDTLPPLLRFLAAHPRAGAVSPAMEIPWGVGPESGGMSPGIRSMAGHYLMVNRLLWKDRGGAWKGFTLHQRRHIGPRRVDWLCAAMLVVRPGAIREVGGFDERFFLYGEDVDLGERLGGAGWELWLVPESRGDHAVGASTTGRVSTRWIDVGHDRYAEHAGPPLVLAFDLLVASGLSVRAAAYRLRRRSARDEVHGRRLSQGALQAWRTTLRTASRICRRLDP